jgi:chemotaxis protein histidine kinase CheA
MFMNNELENKLKELKKGYLKKLEGVFSEFTVLLESEKIDIEKIYSKVHTISGTSGMYGLNKLSDISTDFEVYLKKLKELAKENINSINQEELKNKFSDYLKNIEENILIGE